MLRENWRSIARVERFADATIVVVSFLLAYFLRGRVAELEEILGIKLPLTGESLGPLEDYLVVIVVGVIGYLTTLRWCGAYDSMRLSSFWRLVRIAGGSSCGVFVSLATVLFLLKLDLSRSVVGLFCTVAAVLLIGERYFILRVLRYWRRRGRNFRNMIVCGVGAQAEQFIATVYAHPELGIGIVGVADLGELGATDHSEFKRFLERLPGTKPQRLFIGAEQVAEMLTTAAIDEVVFADVIPVMHAVENLVAVCAEQGVRTTIVADLFSMGIATSHVSYLGEMPLVHYQMPPGDRWELSVKRGIDVFLSAAGLFMFAPLFLVIGTIILATSGRPIFFKQKRVGLNGRLFSLYKFRSMVPNAEALRVHLEAKNEMNGPVFKVRDDPRVTKFGAFLRRFSLDELPQLWNVFRGDMSIVGPRPPMPGEVSLYERRDRRRLSMRPGLTCTWQVSGRSNIRSFDSWVNLDLDYIDNWSLGRDLSLIVRTIPAVLFGNGAR